LLYAESYKLTADFMFYSPKLFIRDTWIFAPFSLSIVCLGIMCWRVFFFINGSMGQIFLHYTSIFGVDLVGEWWKMYYLPLGGILLALINFFVGLAHYRENKFLARFLGVSTLIIEMFLLSAIWLIVGLNI